MMTLPSSTAGTAGAILIVTRSEAFAQSVRRTFDAGGYQSMIVETVSAAIMAAKDPRAALIMIDRTLCTDSAIRQLRDVTAAPIVALKAAADQCSDDECVQDYERDIDLVVCSNSPRELLARVRAILRRQVSRCRPTTRYIVGSIKMDVDRHEVTVRGRLVELTLKEFQILRQFLEAPNRLFTRQEMLNKVWGEGYALEEHALDVHIHSLRHKIEADPTHPKTIITVRGIGYKLRG